MPSIREIFRAKVSTPDFFLILFGNYIELTERAILNSPVFPVKQAKKLKTGSHLQFWWSSGLVPCVWNPLSMQS